MLDSVWNDRKIEEANQFLEDMSPEQRIEWAIDKLPGEFALSSSFGVQSAVSLHMVTQIKNDIPVILVDTGYLFPETYQFVDELTDRLNLNLKVYRSSMSSAWQEARFGQLWEKGVEGLTQYNQLNKVEPMDRGLAELGVQTWFAGLMRSQASSRQNLPVMQKIRGRIKIHPLIDWNNRTVHGYLKKHNLPYHPLWEKGYVSIGDTHSTVPLSLGMSEEDTRFGGVKRECGLHEDSLSGL
ncbi:phosphoadenylyl-sulfate reductase [Aliikangiella sp. IMCC44359]|uniref:phosphoadenylyl-sulfate reductase n=1 Tax=Aliikangiella sp. IMCC44359 TaxID=3459125 RepID=UPI00403B281F